jgi:DNA-binding response OmpR family regulator
MFSEKRRLVMSKILVIDDEPDLARALEIRLKANGYEVGTAFGQKIFENILSFKPDLILLDLFMPEIDGFEILDILAQKEETKSIPVIVFTAADYNVIRKKILERGITDYISKPLDINLLLSMIKNTLGNKTAKKNKNSVLIVDDELVVATALEIRLKSLNFKVYKAASGEECLRVAEGYKPDIILLDILMPKMDGWETCNRLKFNERTKDIPIIVFTASTEHDNLLVKTAKSGAEDFIMKPFKLSELLEKINTALARREKEKKEEIKDGPEDIGGRR